METYPNISTGNGSKQPIFLAVTGALLLTSSCIVSARYYCRTVYAKQLGLDDYFIAIALIVVIALGIFNGFQISWGAGRRRDPGDYPMTAYIHTLIYWYAYQIFYPLSLAITKCSFLALYRRVFPPPNMNRVFFWATAALIVVYTMIIMFVNAFECANPSDAWAPTFPSPNCNDLKGSYYSMAGINIFTDLLVLILPIKPAMQLNASRRKRYAVIGIFMIGGFAVIASVIRIHALWAYFNSENPGYDAIGVLLWGQIEINVGIICASIASLRPLFKSAFSGSQSRSKSSGLQYHAGQHYALGSRQYGEGIDLATGDSKTRVNTKIEAELRDMDNDSQELILDKEEGIMRTIETQITSEQVQARGSH
ncbi:hypothetical protein WHR41_04015 [Cladosporium halotolerans]|uniref:Rhodopsin domain-containing protein n=1 Tax=Cladosporium halotolerans TaxID=1052096 RepID=A0AB34KQ68_9PEZI